MTAIDARFQNDELPSVVEAKDLDARTAEKLRSSSFSNSDETTAERYGRSTSSREQNGANTMVELGDTEMLYKPGGWKNPESDLGGLVKCLFNKWEDRQEDAKDKLGSHIDRLVPREHRDRMKNIHESVVEGNLKGLQNAIKDIPPNQLKDYLKDINQHLKESGSDVKMTLTSRGNVLVYSPDNKSAVEINPKTGETTERVIIGMTKSIPPQMVFGDVEPGDPKEALGKIGDEVTRDTTFGKEDLNPFKPDPYRPRWDEPIIGRPRWDDPIIGRPRWDEPIWGKPHWRDEPILHKPIFKWGEDPSWHRMMMRDSSSASFEK